MIHLLALVFLFLAAFNYFVLPSSWLLTALTLQQKAKESRKKKCSRVSVSKEKKKACVCAAEISFSMCFLFSTDLELDGKSRFWAKANVEYKEEDKVSTERFSRNDVWFFWMFSEYFREALAFNTIHFCWNTTFNLPLFPDFGSGTSQSLHCALFRAAVCITKVFLIALLLVKLGWLHSRSSYISDVYLVPSRAYETFSVEDLANSCTRAI